MLTFLIVLFMAGIQPVTAQQPTGTQPARQGGPGRGGRGAEAPPPPAPPPGSAGTFKSNEELMKVLKERIAAASPGEQLSSPISTTDQYRMNLVRRTVAAGAITHAGNTEVHYVVEGAGTIVTGGKIIRAAAGSNTPATIEGGVTRHMVKGDIIIIPPDSPHWYKDVEGSITYLEVRFVAPSK